MAQLICEFNLLNTARVQFRPLTSFLFFPVSAVFGAFLPIWTRRKLPSVVVLFGATFHSFFPPRSQKEMMRVGRRRRHSLFLFLVKMGPDTHHDDADSQTLLLSFPTLEPKDKRFICARSSHSASDSHKYRRVFL